MRSSGIEKLRYLLSTSPRVVIVACLLVTVLGMGGAGVTYANPPVTEVTDRSAQQTVGTTIETRATVERDTRMYTRGEELVDHPVYLREATPNVTVAAVTTPPSNTDDGVDHELVLRYEARTPEGDVFWQRTVPLETSDRTRGDDAIVSETHLDVDAVDGELEELQAETGDAGDVSVSLQVRTGLEVSGQPVELVDSGHLEIRESSYVVPPLAAQQSVGPTQQRTRPIPSSVVHLGLPGDDGIDVPHSTLLFLGLALLGLLATGIGLREAPRIDREATRTAIHDGRYGDWISEGRLPETLDRPLVHMESLEALADIAIDSKRRVVHDTSRGCYAVVDGTVVYIFAPESCAPDRCS